MHRKRGEIEDKIRRLRRDIISMRMIQNNALDNALIQVQMDEDISETERQIEELEATLTKV